jgi:glycosyltransferase involved in cell wall biosynthesis
MLVFGSLLACWLVLRHGVQVLIAQSPYEGVAAAIAKKIVGWFGCQAVLVVENHGDFEESLFLQRRVIFPRFYRLVMRRSAAFAFKHADLLRAVSNSTREQLERWAPDKLIFQFATWTDIDSFIQVDAEQRRQSQALFYAGVLIPRKGVHHLVSAFAHVAQDFPDARLVIAGREDNKAYAAQLKAQIKQASLDGRVEFVGEVSQVLLAAGMQQANVFVFPSYSEGLPRVVFEAMAAGLPVIASAVSGIPDIVQDNVTGFLVSPGDEAALAERIRWALEHPEAARQMGLRGRNFAKRFFSTAAYVESYREVLDATKVLSGEQSKHATSTL